MAKLITDLRPVYVVGIGLHRYQHRSDTSYVHLGLTAIRAALADAAIPWEEVETSYVAQALLGPGAGRPMLKHLGALGRPLVHIENASASGSAAFRHACIDVASGMTDVALAMGVDKPAAIGPANTGIPSLAEDAIAPFTHFALLTNRYAETHGLPAEDIALVAVKNHANGAKNPNAQRQKVRTLEEILGGRPIAGTLTPLQCTPVGEGAAATIIASEAAISRLGIDAGRAIRVIASTAASEQTGDKLNYDTALSGSTMRRALEDAALPPSAIDILEVHDAFAIEELLYAEALGVCPPGQFIPMLKEGAFNIGGQCAISPSGGLLAMGHPIGPTGLGQICEITAQVRGEAGPRQHPGARTGMAHMVGLGAVSYVHILQR